MRRIEVASKTGPDRTEGEVRTTHTRRGLGWLRLLTGRRQAQPQKFPLSDTVTLESAEVAMIALTAKDNRQGQETTPGLPAAQGGGDGLEAPFPHLASRRMAKAPSRSSVAARSDFYAGKTSS